MSPRTAAADDSDSGPLFVVAAVPCRVKVNPIVIGRAAELECLHSGGILRSPMLPDVTKLSEDELIELNRRIVERLQLLRSARSLAQLARFSVGMVVEFDTDDGRTVTGTIARLNQRTATVVTASGRWRASPGLLRPTKTPHTNTQSPRVIALPRRPD